MAKTVDIDLFLKPSWKIGSRTTTRLPPGERRLIPTYCMFFADIASNTREGRLLVTFSISFLSVSTECCRSKMIVAPSESR